MFSLFKRQKDNPGMDDLIVVLTDEPARTPEEVFRRCHAAEALSAMGSTAYAAMPALLRTLLVPVDVDCVLALRVVAAKAVWKVGGRHDLALPFLAWALKDEYWGVSRKAAQVLGEMGGVAHGVIPDLVRLANRRCTNGPFHFEEFELMAGAAPQPTSLLAVVATVLGLCGRGVAHWKEARRMLTHLTAHGEDDVRTAALAALDRIGTVNG
jgi:hypothetical protein